DNLHVSQVVPGRDDVARGVDELFRRPPEKVAGVARQGFDAVFPLLRQPCPRATGAVDEELPEAPMALCNLRRVRNPGLATVDLVPATDRELASAAENHFLPPEPPHRPPGLFPFPNLRVRTPAASRDSKRRRAIRRAPVGAPSEP